MKKLSVILLFSLFCTLARAQQNAIIYDKTLTPAQQQELAQLVHLYKIQIKKHCDLCCVEKRQHYKKMSPQEFKHMFRKSAQEIEPTIQRIANFYKHIGLSTENINREVSTLQAGLACWCDGIL